MDDKTELTISISQAESLKKIQRMSGWKIIEGFLGKAEAKYEKELKSEANDDLASIKACRKIIGFVKDFRDLLRFTDISAEEDQRELDRLKRKE